MTKKCVKCGRIKVSAAFCRHRLTPDRDLFRSQDGVCAICREPSKSGPLHIDHKQGTKVVRGLLCRRCNMALGMLGENPETILSLARYAARCKTL